MAMMSGALYDALMSVDVPETKARAAAEEVSDIKSEFVKLAARLDVFEARMGERMNTLTWMIATLMTISVFTLGGTFSVLYHLMK